MLAGKLREINKSLVSALSFTADVGLGGPLAALGLGPAVSTDLIYFSCIFLTLYSSHEVTLARRLWIFPLLGSFSILFSK